MKRICAAVLSGVLVLVLGALPARAATIFGLVDTGELYASVDGGVTWAAQSALPVSDAVAIAAAETSNELFLATQSGLVYRSVDGGASWGAVGSVLGSDVVDMLILPSGDILLLTSAGTLYRSQDDGVSFAAIALLTAPNLVGLSRDENDDLYIVARTGEVSRSTDGGTSWSTVGAVTSSAVVRTLGSGSNLYILTDAGDVAESNDQGASWSFVGTISQVNMRGLTLDDGNLVAATKEGLVATSADAANWGVVGSINQLNVVALGNNTPTATGAGPVHPPAALEMTVLSVWPNPAGAGPTRLRFRLPVAATVTIEAYNVRGQRVARRAPEAFASGGDYTVAWSLGALPSGVYFVRVITDTGLAAHSRLIVAR